MGLCPAVQRFQQWQFKRSTSDHEKVWMGKEDCTSLQEGTRAKGLDFRHAFSPGQEGANPLSPDLARPRPLGGETLLGVGGFSRKTPVLAHQELGQAESISLALDSAQRPRLRGLTAPAKTRERTVLGTEGLRKIPIST